MNSIAENMELVVVSNQLVGTVAGQSSLDIQLGKKTPTTLVQPVEQLYANTYPYAFWGTDNQAPVHYDEKIAENTTVQGGIQRRVDKLLAGGVEYGFLDENRQFITKYDEEIEDFLEQAQIQQYINSAFLSYLKYGNLFPEIAFNEPKTKVLWFKDLKQDVRWERQNPKNGIIENAYWSFNYHLNVGVNNALKLPVIDEMFHNFDYIRQNTRDYYYIYQPNIPGPNKYYQMPVWYSTVLQGWHSISMKIPKWFDALMERATTAQFEIIFQLGYFEHIYGTRWTKAANVADKKVMMEEQLTEISKKIQGVDNAGKFFANLKFWDGKTNQMVQGFEVKALDFKSFSGEYLQNMQEADTHTMWAIGEDPISMTNSNASGSGSGSSSKANFNSDMSTNQRHANIFLAPFYFAKRFNGWDKKLKFRIKLPYLADMNQLTNDKRNNGFQDQNKTAQSDAPNNAN